MSTKILNILKSEKVYANTRLVYLVVLILYSVTRQNITCLQPYLLSNLINAGLTLVAFVIVAWDVFVFKNIFKTRHILLLWVFIFLTGISVLLNFKYALFDNIKSVINLCIQFFLLYVSGYKKSKERLHFEARTIAHCLSLLWGIAAAVSFYMYIANIYYEQTRYLWGPEVTISQGFVHTHHGAVVMRLWGVFVDPNFASAISIIVLLLSVFAIYSSKHLLTKILHGINIILQFLYIILSNSRMAMLTFCVILFVGAWFLSYTLFKNRNRILSELLCVVMAVVITFAGVGTIKAVKWALPYIRLDVITSETPSEEVEELEREDIAQKTDISNGRFALLGEGFKVFLKKPIFGVGPRGYHEFATATDSSLVISKTSIHNSYAELLMGNGITGFLVMLAFFLLCAIDTLKLRYRNSKALKPIAFLMLGVFSILASSFFIANLWYTLSGSTIILFAILGYAIHLMKLDEEESLKRDDILFICETPYHVLNAYRLVGEISDGVKKDIYVYNQFHGAASVAERIRESGVFDTVVLINNYTRYTGLRSKIVTLFRMMFPKFTLTRHFASKQQEKRYHTIYAAYFTHLLDSVKAVNPDAKLVLYEDGLVSYIDKNIESEARTGIFKFVDKFFFNNSFTYRSDTLYVTHPNCYKGNYFRHVLPLPLLQSSNTVKTVFGYADNDIYNNTNTIYLTQPLAETSFGDNAYKIEKDILSVLDAKTVIRVHPRQNADDYNGFSLDNVRNPWELDCENNISDNHVLISAFSTALFTPKMLCDKEPTVIFTYKLFGDAPDFEAMTDMLRDMYKNPEKIHVPNTLEEFKECLRKA